MSVEYNEDGSIKGAKVFKEGNVVGEGLINRGGKLEGAWKEYYDDGKLKSEGQYKSNQRVGAWKYYFKSGKTEQEGAYDDKGRLNGKWKWYFEDGKMAREETL